VKTIFRLWLKGLAVVVCLVLLITGILLGLELLKSFMIGRVIILFVLASFAFIVIGLVFQSSGPYRIIDDHL
jgi:hypothetical protein